jgi:hypothetical protein
MRTNWEIGFGLQLQWVIHARTYVYDVVVISAADCNAVETCFGACYDGCKTKPLPRPLRAGAGGSVSTASGPIFSSSSEPDKDGATTKKHPFHEKQDGVRPSSEAPGKDDAATEKHPFHEKQDGVQPASEQQLTPLSEIHAAPPAP